MGRKLVIGEEGEGSGEGEGVLADAGEVAADERGLGVVGGEGEISVEVGVQIGERFFHVRFYTKPIARDY